ncbi:MAG: excinuclease ABC subunit UvrC [Clostridiales bacterium]|jgi:excinuclease ABC subunit C|nr:excinuclease ABC subunit UvrC [Clostridiales bacterium]
MSFIIQEELKKLPTSPGVYLHKDSLGEIIYVGKAINLRNRVRQYFRKQDDPKVKALVSNIAEFEYISCATEMEALVLECNLIKKYMPKYNILLKDDKSYPYIKVTTAEDFPRIFKTRKLIHDGNTYFGPYSDVNAVTEIIKMIDELYVFKKCSTLSFHEGVRPCLNYHIGKCKGICIGAADSAEYQANIKEIIDVLNGKDSELIALLERKMYEASDKMEFESAAKYRDYIDALKKLSETQRAAMVKERDVDILIPIITLQNGIVVQYTVRDGKLVGREVNYLRDEGAINSDSERKDLVEAFIKQFYASSRRLPKEILLNVNVSDAELITGFLNQINETNASEGSDNYHKTKLHFPERGEKKDLLQLAIADSIELAKSLDERATREKERVAALRDEISTLIEKCCELSVMVPQLISEDDEREYRVEAFDISNLNGLDTVGAMVVYEGRKAIRDDYRKFKIRTAANGDDYASLQEVIYRRLKRLKNRDDGFDNPPDIMFIDGGLGQVHAVRTVMDAFGILIPVVGLAKDNAHRTRAIVFEDGSEIDLKTNKMLFSYAGTIQEEVHRFAITFMRGVRSKQMLKSALEDIPAIGPKRRTNLLKQFGSIDAIKVADYESLMETPGMNSKAAESVMAFFQEIEEKSK